MTDNKLTDEQIMKAKAHFEYGINYDIFSEPVLSYAKTVLQAFEEIKRQKAEIEEYPFKCKVGNNSEIHSKSIQDYDKLIADISVSAIKEFAEKLKAVVDGDINRIYAMGGIGGAIGPLCKFKDDIDNLLKEMESEQ